MFGEQNGLGAGSSGNSLQNGSGPPSSLSTPVVASPPAPKQPEQVAMKAKADRHETEDFYLTVRIFLSRFNIENLCALYNFFFSTEI